MPRNQVRSDWPAIASNGEASCAGVEPGDHLRPTGQRFSETGLAQSQGDEEDLNPGPLTVRPENDQEAAGELECRQESTSGSLLAAVSKFFISAWKPSTTECQEDMTGLRFFTPSGIYEKQFAIIHWSSIRGYREVEKVQLLTLCNLLKIQEE